MRIGFAVCFMLAMLCGKVEADATTHAVTIEGMHYVPERLTVQSGDRIVWKNRDLVPHTVTDDAFDSQQIAPEASWSIVLRKPGSYLYRCKLHPGMHAILIVR
jgi:plastocyanin